MKAIKIKKVDWNFVISLVLSVVVLGLMIYAVNIRNQNEILKEQLTSQNTELQAIKAKQVSDAIVTDAIKTQVDRVIRYQRCASLLRYYNGDLPLKPSQIDKCQTESGVTIPLKSTSKSKKASSNTAKESTKEPPKEPTSPPATAKTHTVCDQIAILLITVETNCREEAV